MTTQQIQHLFHEGWELQKVGDNIQCHFPHENLSGWFEPHGTGWKFSTKDICLRDDVWDDADGERGQEGDVYTLISK